MIYTVLKLIIVCITSYNSHPKICKSPEDAVDCIKSGDRVFLHSGCSTPGLLVDAMATVALEKKLHDIKVMSLLSMFVMI